VSETWHLQFGVDAASAAVASWHTLQPVRHPRVLLGSASGYLERTVAAKTRTSPSGRPIRIPGKRPPIYVREDTPWSAARNVAHSHGFAASLSTLATGAGE
jgi:hypothetical protein